MWDVSDEALVAGLGAGETDAALVFIRRFQRRVFGLALSIVRDHQVAEEVAQDTFVRAWRYSASYDPLSRAGGGVGAGDRPERRPRPREGEGPPA